MERTRSEHHEFGVPDIGIPFEILVHPKLTNTEKILYGYIRNLSLTERGCFATREYLAGLMNIKKDTITRALANLKYYEVIKIEEYVQSTYTNRIIYPNPEYEEIFLRMISPNKSYKKINRGVVEKSYPPMKKFLVQYYATHNIEDVSKIPHEKLIFNLLPEDWKNNIEFMNSLVSYTKHRKQKKVGGSLTQEAAKRMAMKLSKYSVEICTVALMNSVENGWTGVFPEKTELPQVEETEKEVTQDSPKDIIERAFKASYAKKFYSLYLEAEKVLTVDVKKYGSDLAHHLIGLRSSVMSGQSSKATGDINIPSGAGIVSAFIEWLSQQEWLDNIKPSAFDFGGPLFEQFIQEYSKEIGYDIFQGTMV
jgi:hypothetical protein